MRFGLVLDIYISNKVNMILNLTNYDIKKKLDNDKWIDTSNLAFR